MTKITCWCCGNPSGQHKLSCNAKSKVEGLVWLLDSLHNVPSDVLTEVAFRVNVELLERELGFLEDEENDAKS